MELLHHEGVSVNKGIEIDDAKQILNVNTDVTVEIE